MARRISDQTIEEIRQRIPIDELIGSRVDLRRSGSSFKACCPFHHEKTPSFVVDPSRRTYHCFGCGAHGDIFKFLMETDGLPFVEAVKQLAERANVSLDLEESYDGGRRKRLFKMHEELAAFYSRCLTQHASAKEARRYLAKRRIDPEIIKQFGLGFAPALPKTLERWAKMAGYTIPQMVEAGLLSPPRKEYSDDSHYDRFQGRLIFPIRDTQGRTVGFSARILNPKDHPAKYINSPETAIFQKSRVLYGLDMARSHIVRHPRREALVCEGQIDVIRCHAHGFNNAIAAQGTAFSESHVQELKRYADSVILFFDGDAAGRKAALRTGTLLLAAGIPVRAASLLPEEDPDSILQNKGNERFQELIDSAASITAFQIEILRQAEGDPESIDAVSRVSSEVLTMLAECPKAVMRSHLLQEAAVLLGLPTEALETDLEDLKRRRRKAPVSTATSPPATVAAPKQTKPAFANSKLPSQQHSNLAFGLCSLLLHHGEDLEICDFVREWLPKELLEDETAREIITAALDATGSDEDPLSELATGGSENTREWLANLARRDSPMLHTQEKKPIEAAQDIVRRLWSDRLKQQRSQLSFDNDSQLLLRVEITNTIKELDSPDFWSGDTSPETVQRFLEPEAPITDG